MQNKRASNVVEESVSSRKLTLRHVIMGLSVFGFLVACYLVYVKFSPGALICSGVGDCEAVNTSVYSTLFGIPVAVYGALTYAAIFIILMLEPRLALATEWGPIATFGLAIIGMLYSGYLTYIELFVIHKICPYCVTSAVAITLICVLAGVRVFREGL